jgi:hypothetical protein
MSVNRRANNNKFDEYLLPKSVKSKTRELWSSSTKQEATQMKKLMCVALILCLALSDIAMAAGGGGAGAGAGGAGGVVELELVVEPVVVGWWWQRWRWCQEPQVVVAEVRVVLVAAGMAVRLGRAYRRPATDLSHILSLRILCPPLILSIS